MKVSNKIVATKRDLSSELKTIIDRARHDAAIFAITTVLLTPFLVFIAVVVFLMALIYIDFPVIDYFGYALSIVTGVNLTLAFMVTSYFLRASETTCQRHESYATWVAVTISLLCVLLLFSYAMSLIETHPSYFWPIYFLISLAILGCIGHAFEPREDYYLGWRVVGPIVIDNPLTFKDDVDRAHFSLGFSMAIPSLIIDSYSAIFGSTWLWRDLTEPELSAAVELMQTLSNNDTTSASHTIQKFNTSSALNIVRTLVKLKMITIDRDRPRLLLKGWKFLGIEAPRKHALTVSQRENDTI